MSLLKPKAPPQRLGRFDVGVKIGGGGMADVYLGRSIDRGVGPSEHELVAIKVIREELGDDPVYIRMFSDEAKLLARLSHPNLVRTLEYGIASDRRFLVMELLAGHSLSEVRDALFQVGESFGFRLAAWITARVAEGLHNAHELVDERGLPMSVIHRDVNPTNIFLTHTGEVKLIDFGLAKARYRRSKTTKGIVKGKVPYLAPEQLRDHDIDRRVDIFSLGTTLWEIGTMIRLFKRETDLETMRTVADCVIPDPRMITPGYPDALVAVVMRALQKDRDARYATAAEMQHELDAFVGPADDMMGELAALMRRLFPHEVAEQALWTHDAAHRKVLATVAPPPMPMNIDLDEDEIVIDIYVDDD